MIPSLINLPIDNTTKLRALMELYELSVDDVANITGRAVPTVRGWRQRVGYSIPDDLLELLELRLQSRNQQH